MVWPKRKDDLMLVATEQCPKECNSVPDSLMEEKLHINGSILEWITDCVE